MATWKHGIDPRTREAVIAGVGGLVDISGKSGRIRTVSKSRSKQPSRSAGLTDDARTLRKEAAVSAHKEISNLKRELDHQ